MREQLVGFQNTTKVAGSNMAPPCQMPGRAATLAKSDPTDFQDVFSSIMDRRTKQFSCR